MFGLCTPPTFYRRYIDDCIYIHDPEEEPIADFLTRLNSLHPSIQFTVEHKQNGCLPYLDLLLTRVHAPQLDMQPIRLDISIYRKPSNSGRFITAASYHHPLHKRAAWNALINRALHLPTTTQARNAELQHIRLLASYNGYRPAYIQSIITHNTRKQLLPPAPARPAPLARISLTYTASTFPALKRIAAIYDLQLVPHTQRTLASALVTYKNRLPPSQCTGVIYSIPCSCNHHYIGETERELATRIHEHAAAWNSTTSTAKTSSVFAAAHSQHTPNFDAACAIHTEPNNNLRRLKEAFLIARAGRKAIPNSQIRISLNISDGRLLDSSWTPLISQLPSPTANSSSGQNSQPPATKMSTDK